MSVYIRSTQIAYVQLPGALQKATIGQNQVKVHPCLVPCSILSDELEAVVTTARHIDDLEAVDARLNFKEWPRLAIHKVDVPVRGKEKGSKGIGLDNKQLLASFYQYNKTLPVKIGQVRIPDMGDKATLVLQLKAAIGVDLFFENNVLCVMHA